MAPYKLLNADCVKAMAEMPANVFDAVVTDPPYNLAFMGKSWDKQGTPQEFQRFSEAWAREALRVLKPGGYLLAFGGTRTYHRQTSGLEDAGFIVRDGLQWLYGSGFPKSHNLKDDWAGFGTALKPANEPIALCQKPLDGTYAANLAKWGCGALNIDGCRIGEGNGKPKPEYVPNHGNKVFGRGMGGGAWENTSGRWPANVLLDDAAAAALDAQSGVSKSKSGGTTSRTGDGLRFGMGTAPCAGHDDEGSASRFFYVAKASKRDRGEGNTHPTVKPTQLMQYLVRLVCPPRGLVLDPFAGSGTTGVAAAREGVRFVGAELDVENYATALRRVSEAYAARVQHEAAAD